MPVKSAEQRFPDRGGNFHMFSLLLGDGGGGGRSRQVELFYTHFAVTNGSRIPMQNSPSLL